MGRVYKIAGCTREPSFRDEQRRLITGCGDGPLKFLSLTSGQEVLTLKAQQFQHGQGHPPARQRILTDGQQRLRKALANQLPLIHSWRRTTSGSTRAARRAGT